MSRMDFLEAFTTAISMSSPVLADYWKLVNQALAEGMKTKKSSSVNRLHPESYRLVEGIVDGFLREVDSWFDLRMESYGKLYQAYRGLIENIERGQQRATRRDPDASGMVDPEYYQRYEAVLKEAVRDSKSTKLEIDTMRKEIEALKIVRAVLPALLERKLEELR